MPMTPQDEPFPGRRGVKLPAITMVRHAQASFGSEDYDRLSPLGFQQARTLGSWLLEHGLKPARVVTGRLRRHRETWQAVAEMLYADGHCEAPLELPGLDEFDFGSVLEAHARRGGRRLDSIDARAHPRQVYDVLHDALLRWASGELDGLAAEDYADFRARVHAAGRRLVELARSEGPVLAISSGGVIASLAQYALQIPDQRAIELNLTIRNTSITEFVINRHGLMLASWNALPHLASPAQQALVTYY